MEERPQIMNPKTKHLVIFWARMVGWALFSCILPIITFSVKFGLFDKPEPKVDSLGNVIESASISLNGWGLISCALIGFAASAVVTEIIAAHPDYSLTKQCLLGFKKTILPLLIGFFICMFINNVVTHIMFCLATLVICQAVAIVLNPLPKWRYEKTGAEEYSSAIAYLTNFVKLKRDASKKGDF